jgi:hypothetical protein
MNIKTNWKIFLLLTICIISAAVFFSLNSFSKRESDSIQQSIENKVLGEKEKFKSEVKIGGKLLSLLK